MSRSAVLAVRDVKAEAYTTPFFALTTGMGIRQFSDVCQNPQAPFNKHAVDYSLYKVGEFDEVSGDLIPMKPEFLCQATDFIKVDVKKEA